MKQRYVLALLLFAISCAHHAAVPALFDTQKQIDNYIDSGKYEADCMQVANQAHNYLEQRVKKGGKLAIVLDIDETSLSNWPAYRINHWARILTGECDLQKGPCNIQKYQAMAQAKAIAPTLVLANFARENHVAVFFVTGRGEDLRQATEKNLRDAGYHWDGLILKAAGKNYPSAVDFKAPARKQIMQRGYTIIFTMGDQWSDLSGGYAERSFKYPNPVYYLP